VSYKSESELAYSDYYVRLRGDVHHPMVRVNASNPASAVQQYLREHPAFGERGAWVWKVVATEDGREVLGLGGLASYHEFSIPHVSNCDGAILPVQERPAEATT
jgi:hypothetical protein